MSESVSTAQHGAEAARAALERCVGSGGVAVFPADGLYGLACDPLSPDAVDRIHTIKGRSPGKPSAVMYFTPMAMRELLASLDPPTREACALLLPGPVTLVVANPERRYPLACGDHPERLGVRLIDGPLDGARFPIFQTSANRSGEPPPAAFEGVDGALLAEADLAIDGGALTGKASTVVDVAGLADGAGWRVIREGGLPAVELERRLAVLVSSMH